MSIKICTLCKIEKELTEFNKNTNYEDGLLSKCKSCNNAQRRAIYRANPEKQRAKSLAYQKANPDKERARNKAKYEANIEKRKAQNKVWRLANLEKIKTNQKIRDKIWTKSNSGKKNAYTAKRRAKKLQATPLWLTPEQHKEMIDMYILAKELRWLSESPLEVDHIIPLQGENISGLHVPWNLQILPKSMNRSKGNKLIPTP